MNKHETHVHYRQPIVKLFLPAQISYYKLLEGVWQAMSNHNQKTGMFGNEDDAIRAARMRRLDEREL